MPTRTRANNGRDDARRGPTYADPLVYDIIHAPGTRAEVAALVRIAARFAGTPGRRFSAKDAVWLEPACGSGRCVRELLNRGGACVGVDIDPGMIEYARASVPPGQRSRVCWLAGDMRRLDAPSVVKAIEGLRGADGAKPVVALCPHNSVRHLGSDRDMALHLRSTARVLARFGGVYLVGIGLSGPGGEGACETVFTSSRRGVRVREVIDFVPPSPSARGIAARREHAYKHVSVRTRGQEREIISAYTLRTYTPAQWSRVLRAGGMREIGVIGAWGEEFDAARLHYAYRVLAPAGAGDGPSARSVRAKKSAIRV